MDVSVKKLPQSKAEITVTLPWSEWEKEIGHAAEHLAEEVKIEGFRKGKIPRAMLEKKIGRNTLLIEGAEHAIDHTYPHALLKAEVVAIGKPEASLGKVAEGEPLEYTVTTAIMPDITLGEWDMRVKQVNKNFKDKEETVSDAEVEEELVKIAESRAKYVTVMRGAKDGDMVEVDFTVIKDNVPIEGGTSRKHPVVLGKGAFIPGFEEHLIGIEAGQERTFALSFPKEYHAKHLAGQPAEFRVKALLVQEREIPAIDDAFAGSLGNFETLEALRMNIHDGMLEEKKMKAKETHRIVLLEAAIDGIEAEFPEVLVENELDRMVREFENQVGAMGMSFDDFLAQTKKTTLDLRREWAPQAKKRILSGLALETIAGEEEITVEQTEIEEDMNKALAYFKSVKQAEDKIDLQALYSASQTRLRNEKVFERLEAL
jgi:trigger factor